MKNVLIVDDDQIFNFLSTKILRRIGIISEIRTALNGRQAMELINKSGPETTPDIILLDLNMPVMDGFGFLEAFGNLPNTKRVNTQIIIVSSSQDPHDIKRARELGAAQYLSKPLTEHSLRTALAIQQQ